MKILDLTAPFQNCTRYLPFKLERDTSDGTRLKISLQTQVFSHVTRYLASLNM